MKMVSLSRWAMLATLGSAWLAACSSTTDDAGSDGGPEAAADAAADTGADAGSDAPPDALPDALPDATPDALPDALPDATPDALPDALPDATDESTDAGTDATDESTDAGTDATDESTDAGTDATDASDAGAGPFVVFDDDYTHGETFSDFVGATNTVKVDTTVAHSGTASLSIAAPPAGNYTGGFVGVLAPVDLSSYDALTFWAKADAAGTFDKVGFGVNAASNAYAFRAQAPLALTTTWQKFVVPLPDPKKASTWTGLLFFATGAGQPYTKVWLDDVQYETLGSAIGAPTPYIATEAQNITVGGNGVQVNGSRVDYTLGGNVVSFIPDSPANPWFDWSSSDTGVATVSASGLVQPVAAGAADITASLLGVAANGKTTVTVAPAPAKTAPDTAAPKPTASGVLSLYNSSGTYTDHVLDNYRSSWSGAALVDPYTIAAGGTCKEYTGMGFVGMETYTNAIDASGYAYFHVDVWSAEITQLGVKLVDFTSMPPRDPEVIVPVTTGQWFGIDIPLSQFPTVTGVQCGGLCVGWVASNIEQVLLVNETPMVTGNLFVDNMYFHN